MLIESETSRLVDIFAYVVGKHEVLDVLWCRSAAKTKLACQQVHASDYKHCFAFTCMQLTSRVQTTVPSVLCRFGAMPSFCAGIGSGEGRGYWKILKHGGMLHSLQGSV